MEVDEEAEAEVGELEIGQKLGFVDWMELLYRLKVYDDRMFDYQVDSISDIEGYASIHDGECHLSLDKSPRYRSSSVRHAS